MSTRYEYIQLSLKYPISVEELAKYGELGWQMCGAIRNIRYVYYFCRLAS